MKRRVVRDAVWKQRKLSDGRAVGNNKLRVWVKELDAGMGPM
jgi:hypothetical protein